MSSSSRSRSSSVSSFELVDNKHAEKEVELSGEQLELLKDAQKEAPIQMEESERVKCVEFSELHVDIEHNLEVLENAQEPEKLEIENYKVLKSKFIITSRHRNRLHKQIGNERKRAEEERCALLEKAEMERKELEKKIEELKAEQEVAYKGFQEKLAAAEKEARTAEFLEKLSGEWRLLSMREYNAHLKKYNHSFCQRIRALLATNNYQVERKGLLKTWGSLFYCKTVNDQEMVIGAANREFEGKMVRLVTEIRGDKLVTEIKDRNIRTERYIENGRLHIVHHDCVKETSTRVFEKVTRRVQIFNQLITLGRAFLPAPRANN